MKYMSSRRQVRISNQNQLFHPDQLEEGSTIGVYRVIDGPGLGFRVARTAVVFTGLLPSSDPNKPRMQSTKEAWNHKDLEGVLPDWMGVFEGHRSNGMCAVRVTAESPLRSQHGLKGLKELMNTAVEDLPTLEEPYRLHPSYDSMGLMPIGSTYGNNDSLPRGLIAPRPDQGRWERAATVLIGPSPQ